MRASSQHISARSCKGVRLRRTNEGNGIIGRPIAIALRLSCAAKRRAGLSCAAKRRAGLSCAAKRRVSLPCAAKGELRRRKRLRDVYIR